MENMDDSYLEVIMYYRKLAYWAVSKEKWNTKEDKGKSMVGALYIQSYAKRHLSAEATWSSEKIKSVTFIIALHLSEGIRQADRLAGGQVGRQAGRRAIDTLYVTRFYRTDPNRTSGKIKLTPPVDSYTIVLQVLTLSTTQTTRGWFLHTYFLGGVECSNGGFRPCEGPGLARVSGLLVDSLIMLARRVLC